ncbi:MAG TPA: 2-oxo acid dehydrogenase subunit E2, partial [Candidatus Eisenbacteria bacterium]|nr:2-oxo acid dehydrogenase subunit E2 [Candidatus Eisenbacteria bacterium]
MATEIKVPRLAESISEGVLVQWLKQDGEHVKADEPIATLETDKAAVEIPADREGVLRHAKKVGDKVEVGEVIARLEDAPAGASAGTASGPAATEAPEAKASEARAAEPSSAEAPAPPSPAAPAAPSPPVAPPAKAAPAPPHNGEEALSPSVRRMVEEFGVDPASIPASGKGGRLLKEDVQRYLETRGTATARPAAKAPSSKPAAPPATGEAARPAPREAPRAAAVASGEAVSPKVSAWLHEEDERAVPMSRIRQRIAERLVQAQHTAAILTTFNEVDMSAVMDLRTRFKESFEQKHGVRLSFMSFFTRACVLALEQIPEINAQIRGADIVYQRHVHMGVAVQTGRGLVVPVVRNADLRSFADLEREIARLAAAARDNKLMLDELAG